MSQISPPSSPWLLPIKVLSCQGLLKAKTTLPFAGTKVTSVHVSSNTAPYGPCLFSCRRESPVHRSISDPHLAQLRFWGHQGQPPKPCLLLQISLSQGKRPLSTEQVRGLAVVSALLLFLQMTRPADLISSPTICPWATASSSQCPSFLTEVWL